MKKLIVESTDIIPRVDSIRLDLFLSRKTTYSREFFKTQIKNRKISINNTIVTKPSHPIVLEDEVLWDIDDDTLLLSKKNSLTPIKGPLDIIYEDNHLLAINKQPNLVVHPSPTYQKPTLVHYCLHYFLSQSSSAFSELTSENPLSLRPGIVHRLDKDTTGILLIAKTRKALESLSLQFKNRTIHKEYEAIVWGVRKEKEKLISGSLGRDIYNRKKISSTTKTPRKSVTLMRVKATLGNYCSYLSLIPKTGRTHQLRVHLKELHSPIVGDSLYDPNTHKRFLSIFGAQNTLQEKKTICTPNLHNYLFLHAQSIRFSHPETGNIMEIRAKTPSQFFDFIDLCQNHQHHIVER